MNVRHLMAVSHLFPIKTIFYDRIDLGLFYFDQTIYSGSEKLTPCLVVAVQPCMG